MIRGSLRPPGGTREGRNGRMGKRPSPDYPPRVLRFERQVVASLVTTPDPGRRAAVEAYVDGALRAMPEHLRAGVVAESLLLGTWDRARRRGSPGAVDLDPLERSRIDVVRQYVRLLRSLVLFAENELAPAS